MKPSIEALLGMFRDENVSSMSYENALAYDKSHQKLAPLLVKAIEILDKYKFISTEIPGATTKFSFAAEVVAEIESALTAGAKGEDKV